MGESNILCRGRTTLKGKVPILISKNVWKHHEIIKKTRNYSCVTARGISPVAYPVCGVWYFGGWVPGHGYPIQVLAVGRGREALEGVLGKGNPHPLLPTLSRSWLGEGRGPRSGVPHPSQPTTPSWSWLGDWGGGVLGQKYPPSWAWRGVGPRSGILLSWSLWRAEGVPVT